jgi:hypothetical protein
MTMDFQSRSLVNADMPAWYYDGVTAVTRDRGTLGGTVRLGDGTTTAGFPTQLSLIAQEPHGMYFDGANDYLRKLESAAELTFTDPLPFSVELLLVRSSIQTGSYGALCGHPGGGVGSSDPYAFFLYNNAGTMQIWLGSISSVGATRGIIYAALGSYFPEGITTHVVGQYDGTTWRIFLNGAQTFTNVAAGCYAPDAAAQGLLIGALANGSAAPGVFAQMKCYNFALYPFALLPGEVAQLCRARMALVYRGA